MKRARVFGPGHAAAVWLLAIAYVVGIGTRTAHRAHAQQAGSDPLQVFPVQPNFYMLLGAGGNIAVQIGPEGVVLVDAGSATMADAVIAAVKKLTDKPIRYVINTSADADHVGGNEKIARAGQPLFAPGMGGGGGGAAGGIAAIAATENVLARMGAVPEGGTDSAYPSAAWPVETFAGKQKSMYVNREGIAIMAQPAAHSDGDSIVFFRRSDVIVTGDIFDIRRFPVIDVEKGGSVQGEIDALNRIMELAIPSIPLPYLGGGTAIIPGHGRLCEQAEVVEYRDMVTIIRDRVQASMKSGMTLEQVKAANPAAGYVGRYGSDSGPWTTTMFVEAVYKSLAGKK